MPVHSPEPALPLSCWQKGSVGGIGGCCMGRKGVGGTYVLGRGKGGTAAVAGGSVVSDVVGLCSDEESKCMEKLDFVSSAGIRCYQS